MTTHEADAMTAPESVRTEPALLEMTGIRKTFGQVVALNDAEFTVGRSEVHGLLGGNGAGKTTLMNVLYGLYRPDTGRIVFDGREITVRSPRDAIKHGIGMVHQNFLQVDTYTVVENIVLGTRASSFPALDLREAEEKVAELSQRFGLTVDPRARVERLSVGIRQRVEILKALYRGARLLVLDEPTTNLTPQEVDSLFGSLRAIVDEGMSVVFITHKIRETMAVCDRLTVMRDGRRVATMAKSDITPHDLAALMVGDEQTAEKVATVVGEVAPGEAADPTEAATAPPAVSSAAAPRLRVEGLVVVGDHGVDAVRGVDLDVRPGEIVGVAGVAGNGQVELAEALAGVRQIRAGHVRLDEQDLVGRPTAAWLDAGVAYVPEDRHRDGILPAATITENLMLGAQRSRRFRRWGGLLDWGAARRNAVEAVKTYSIRAPGIDAPAAALSGGNIQRLILARAFSRRPKLLILHNPTRGLDIRSTQFVYERVREITADGAAVLLLSEDLDELTTLSDRIAVIYGGRIVGERSRGAYDQYELGRLMAGIEESA